MIEAYCRQIDKLIMSYNWDGLQTFMHNMGVLRDREKITAAEYIKIKRHVEEMLS